MKNKSICLIVLLLIAGSAFAQITFQKVISTPNGSYANEVKQTRDSGYIIAGWYNDIINGAGKGYLVKTNTLGDTVWTRVYAAPTSCLGGSVLQTPDGGYICLAEASGPDGNFHVWLIRTNANGDSLWTKTYGGAGVETVAHIQPTNDGGYILVGTTTSFGAGGHDVYLIKINVNGGITWSKTYGGSGDEYGSGVEQTADSGYIITGSTTSFGAGQNDVYLIKTNVNGDTLWTKTYGGSNYDAGYAALQTADGGYMLTGYTWSFGAGNYDVCLIRTDANGNMLWANTYGGSKADIATSLQQTADGGYIIGGYSLSFNTPSYDAYIIKTNAGGDTLWSKIYGGPDDNGGSFAMQTFDGGYIIAGGTQNYSNSETFQSALYLIKTDSAGTSNCLEANPQTIVASAPMIVGNTHTIVSSGGALSYTNIVVSSGGDDSTLCLSVGAQPLANFLASDTVLCANDCISFTNLSSNATSYEWFFAGAADSASTSQTPSSVCYQSPGAYNVTLVASNAGGRDSVTFSRYIYVMPAPPVPVITQSHDTLRCSTDSLYTSYQWSLDSAIIPGATDTFLIIAGGGNYNVQVSNKNNCSIAAGANIILGIQNYPAHNMLSLYPNPATDQLFITGNWQENKSLQLTIYNILGEIIHSETLNRKLQTINCKPFPSGVYFITVANANEQWVGRFIKE